MNALDAVWRIPLCPLLGAALMLLLGPLLERKAKALITVVCLSSVLASFVLSALAVGQLAAQPVHRYEREYFTWFAGLPFATAAHAVVSPAIPWGYLLDPLSSVMILIITGVGLLIHLYSVGYMGHEEGYWRFFAYLNLFVFFMLLLVLANNYVLLFAGWEGVGLCSYLLIGFYTERNSAGDAANKAFLTNRVGDAAFLLGIFLLFAVTGSARFTDVSAWFAASGAHVESGVLSILALLLFLGAAGKSAQFPLHVWLPDAMEGPTPVSALIHAATMVTAGVYLIARSSAIYELTPGVSTFIACIGAFTAIMAASIALVQTDIKKVLAYSTISQLGYMFMALGAGAYSAALFHVFTHAFFKALLFLGAGSVIHALGGEQDMRAMGALRRKMPVTHATMFIASLAIAGVPGLAGFFSKDEILWRLFSSPFGFKSVYAVGLITAFMTAFYMWRLMFLTFYGDSRLSESAAHHVHESPRIMTVPLILLAFGSAVAGWIGVPRAWTLFGDRFRLFEAWLSPVFEAGRKLEAAPESLSTEWLLMGVSTLAALGGILLASQRYRNRPFAEPPQTAVRMWLANQWYIDHVYRAVFVRGLVQGGGRALGQFDRRVIDGGVNGVGRLTRALSSASIFGDTWIIDGLVRLASMLTLLASFPVRLLESGAVQTYALYVVAGALAAVTLYLWK